MGTPGYITDGINTRDGSLLEFIGWNVALAIDTNPGRLETQILREGIAADRPDEFVEPLQPLAVFTQDAQ